MARPKAYGYRLQEFFNRQSSAGKSIITAETRKEMRAILTEVQDGSYAASWIEENKAGRPFFDAIRQREREHPIEKVGRDLRAMMPWLNPKEI